MNAETITRHGLTFRVRIESDDDNPQPWKECDGHGHVREITDRGNDFNARPRKRPGERFLIWERGYAFAYDWQRTMKTARADAWGIAPEARAALAAKLGREPTAREEVAESVRFDFERLREWCAGDWYYVGVVVELLDVEGDATGETESLWRIESDSHEYHEEVAHELADELAARLDLTGTGRRRKVLQRAKGARAERIRVRA